MMRRTLAFGLFLLLTASTAGATPFVITSMMTGDGRPANPDNLNILVTITGDTTSNVANWTVDLNMPVDHPSARLDGFWFNMDGAVGDYSMSAFLPAGWGSISGNNVPGSGGADFMFGVGDLPGGPSNDVTNTVNLTFSLTRVAGTFSIQDFLLAPDSCSNDALLGCGQLGAHVVSLNAGPGQSDSGFALGDYDHQAPEPGLLILLGCGVAGVAARRLRASRQ